MHVVECAKEVISKEILGLKQVHDEIDDTFAKVVHHIHDTNGRVVVCGIGKSGLVGKKISATLASTGTVSFFLHPSEAFHGDLGMIKPEDIVIAISNSGETEELLKIFPFFKSNGNTLISITASEKSTMGKNSDHVLKYGVLTEACPLELAPTTSTTVALALGDALAVCLMKIRGFKEENYAKFHPGGSLGRKLLNKVKDFMVINDLPVVKPEDGFENILSVMTKGRLGICLVMDGDKLFGVITDGDLRRLMKNEKETSFFKKAKDFLSTTPILIQEDAKIIEAETLMHDKKVSNLVVCNNENKVSGILQIYQTS